MALVFAKAHENTADRFIKAPLSASLTGFLFVQDSRACSRHAIQSAVRSQAVRAHSGDAIAGQWPPITSATHHESVAGIGLLVLACGDVNEQPNMQVRSLLADREMERRGWLPRLAQALANRSGGLPEV